MSTHGGIKLNNSFIPARRLVSPAKRIILSNVSPSLPHEIVEKELKQIGLKIVSPVRFIGAGISKEGYKHILSFRRQVYVILDEHERLPDSLLIYFRENAFRIFLTTDEIRCFQCKKMGHIASKCPTHTDSIVVEQTKDTSTHLPIDSSRPSVSAVQQEAQEPPASQITDALTIIQPSKKRQAPPSTPTDSEPILFSAEESDPQPLTTVEDKVVFIKPKSKKKKHDCSSDSNILYAEFKDSFSDRVEVTDFYNFCNFLEEVKGKQDALSVAKLYTDDVNSLVDLLIRIVRVVKTNNLKSRLKRLIKKIKKALDPKSYVDTLSQDDSGSTTTQDDFSDTSEI